MCWRKSAKSVKYFAFLVLASISANTVNANCSDRHIRALDQRGKSVSDIARMCEMSKADVLAALEDNGDDDDTLDSPRNNGSSRGGLPSGAQLSACGCWGYVATGAGAANAMCASGYEHAVACGGVCPAGGLPWARICQ
jgi:hypothetical protein